MILVSKNGNKFFFKLKFIESDHSFCKSFFNLFFKSLFTIYKCFLKRFLVTKLGNNEQNGVTAVRKKYDSYERRLFFRVESNVIWRFY